MLAIVGLLVVIISIVGGYLMEHGNIKVLLQPAELVIIGGAASGTLLIANPLPTVIAVLKGVVRVFKGNSYTRTFYLDNLTLLNELFAWTKKNGIMQLEAHIEDPNSSAILTKYAWFLRDHHTVAFVCDTLRMYVTGGVAPHEIDQMMELDIEVHHHEHSNPVHALTSVADALPGLGIVAAVLGIVVTMGALGGPPEEIGHKVAAALVGTFLGVLLCYGFVGPMAANLTKRAEAHNQYLYVLRVGLFAFVRGTAPILATEFARRAVPTDVRPSFAEMEKACKAAVAGSQQTPEGAAA